MENKTKQADEKEKNVITKHQFYFDAPLYQMIEVADIEGGFMKGDVDGYNSVSGFDTTYRIEPTYIGCYNNDYTGFHAILLTCKRNGEDRLRFFIIKSEKYLMKVGQSPSLADIQFAELGKKYNKVLDDRSIFEFKRAIGLAAHGTGVGSFVYLRRIFERLIFQTFANKKGSLKISEEDFLSKRMEEKVEILKVYLPSQLVEMKLIYSILSKGIHELDENECLVYFEPLKLCIELILDQKIEINLKQERDRKVKEEIKIIQEKLS